MPLVAVGLRREVELGSSLVPAAPAASPRGGRRRRPWTAPALNAVGALPAGCPARLPAAFPQKRGERGVGGLRERKKRKEKEKKKKRDDESDFPSESLGVHVLKAWNQFSVAAPPPLPLPRLLWRDGDTGHVTAGAAPGPSCGISRADRGWVNLASRAAGFC